MKSTSTKANARLAPGECGKASQSAREHSASSTATEAQLQRLLELLRLRRHHTHELRARGISHPAGRVQDLEARGYVICSSRINTVDSDGFVHVGVALYELLGEPAEAL